MECERLNDFLRLESLAQLFKSEPGLEPMNNSYCEASNQTTIRMYGYSKRIYFLLFWEGGWGVVLPFCLVIKEREGQNLLSAKPRNHGHRYPIHMGITQGWVNIQSNPQGKCQPKVIGYKKLLLTLPLFPSPLSPGFPPILSALLVKQ